MRFQVNQYMTPKQAERHELDDTGKLASVTSLQTLQRRHGLETAYKPRVFESITEEEARLLDLDIDQD